MPFFRHGFLKCGTTNFWILWKYRKLLNLSLFMNCLWLQSLFLLMHLALSYLDLCNVTSIFNCDLPSFRWSTFKFGFCNFTYILNFVWSSFKCSTFKSINSLLFWFSTLILCTKANKISRKYWSEHYYISW